MLTGEIEASQQVLAVLAEQEAQTKLRRAGTSTDVRVLDEPPMPAKRDRPRIARDGALGLAVGALIAVLVVLAYEAMQRGFRTLRELRLGLGMSILAVLRGPRARRPWQPAEIDAGQVQQLVQLLTSSGQMTALVHLGRHPSYDLCWALSAPEANQERPALIIDADVLGGQLSRALNQPTGAGLAEACDNPGQLEDLVVSLADGLLRLAAAACQRYAQVLVCLPTPGRWPRPETWASSLNEVVLTVPQGGASRNEIAAELARLNKLGLSVRGIAVTNYSAVRDPLGAEETALVAVTPPGPA
jgi:hypothetical protein